MRIIIIAALATLVTAGIVQANGKKNGFDQETSTSKLSGQGTAGKVNTSANAGNNGKTITETTKITTGPKGQLKNDRSDCNNCNTVTETKITDLPGKKR